MGRLDIFKKRVEDLQGSLNVAKKEILQLEEELNKEFDTEYINDLLQDIEDYTTFARNKLNEVKEQLK